MKIKFKDAVQIISGGTPKTSIPEYWNGDIGWLSVVDFGNKNKYVETTEKTITQKGLENSSTKLLATNDIILSARGTVGAMAMLKCPLAFNQSCFGLRTNTDLLDQDYLFYYLKNYMKMLKVKKQGSVFDTINLSTFDLIDLDLPTVENQEKVANLLSDIDNKIELNNDTISELDSLAKTIYDYWFLQFEFPNEEGKPYKSSGGKMVWNEELKREIPEGWEVGNLYDIAEFINGLACQKYRPIDEVHKLPVIKIGEMHNGIRTETEWARDDVPEKNKIDNGDILFSWSATLETMIWNMGKGVLNQHIFKVIPKKYNRYYVYQQLSAYIINFIKMAETRKTTMGHITTDHLKQSRIPLPPNEISDKYESTVNSFFEKYLQCSKENQELTSLRDFLLPMLMNGQVTFKEKL